MTEWRPTKLKHLASIRAGTWGDEPDGAGHDVYCVRAADFDRQRLRVSREGLPLRSVEPVTFTVLSLQPGDIVLEKSGGGPDQPVGGAALFELDEAAVCSNFTARLRALPGVEPRFLNYLLASTYYSGLTRAFAKQTTGIANLDVGAYMATSCKVPPAPEQRAIADYLDMETARIDALVDALHARVGLLAGRRRSVVSTALAATSATTTQVRRLVSTVTSGPRGWAQYEVDEPGSYFLRIANVPPDAMDLKLEEVAFVDPPQGDEAHRCRVQPGDVLTTITAAIGQVAVVPAGLSEAYVSQHLALLRPDGSKVLPDWLAMSLWTDDAQRQLDAARYGGTKQQLSLEDVREIRVPVTDLPTQRSVVSRVRRDLEALRALTWHSEGQATLLLERRQALITAAVTGQLDIPGVAA